MYSELIVKSDRQYSYVYVMLTLHVFNLVRTSLCLDVYVKFISFCSLVCTTASCSTLITATLTIMQALIFHL